jgi:hypothetical protein
VRHKLALPLIHLSRRASTSDADEDFRSDLELVTASWAAIQRSFRGRGIKQPRQLVLDPRARPAIWLLPKNNEYGNWPASGEIDILESRGNDVNYPAGGVNTFGSTLHWGTNWD